jgi:hypothetical protein
LTIGIIGEYYCPQILFHPITMVFPPVISLPPVACNKRRDRFIDTHIDDMFSEGITHSIYMYTGETLLVQV